MKIQYADVRATIGEPQGPCLVCGLDKPTVWDHCHAHGWTRGPLCTSCNGRMGWFDSGTVGWDSRDPGNLSTLRKHWRECHECAAGPEHMITASPRLKFVPLGLTPDAKSALEGATAAMAWPVYQQTGRRVTTTDMVLALVGMVMADPEAFTASMEEAELDGTL